MEAAVRLMARDGPAETSITRIARALRAPVGSIYHRFQSRDVLLGEVWLRAAGAFQSAYFERLAAPLAREAGLMAARYMAERVREHPKEARLLLIHRREDFVDRGWPTSMRRRATELAHQVDSELRAFCIRLCGRDDARSVGLVTYAVLGAPFAAVRPHVSASQTPPPYVDELIRVTYEAVIGRLLTAAEPTSQEEQ